MHMLWISVNANAGISLADVVDAIFRIIQAV
jgi:hypothetical protein